jgi:hypothetical protein
MLDGNDRRFVRRLFRELPASVYEVVKELPLVRPETGVRNQVVRRNEDVHEVDLQDADASQDVAQLPRAYGAGGPS